MPNFILGIALSTVAQFVFAAVWYTFLFGNLWGKMHGFDKLSKEEQNKMMSQMGPIYLGQFLFTVFTSWGLAHLMTVVDYSPYLLAVVLWLGFLVPTHYSNVVFGGTPAKWIAKKVGVLAGASFFELLIAAGILSLFI